MSVPREADGDRPPPSPPRDEPPRDDPPPDETRPHSEAAPQLSPEQLDSLATQVTQKILKQLGTAGDATALQAGSPRTSSSSADGGEHSQKGRRGGRRLFTLIPSQAMGFLPNITGGVVAGTNTGYTKGAWPMSKQWLMGSDRRRADE